MHGSTVVDGRGPPPLLYLQDPTWGFPQEVANLLPVSPPFRCGLAETAPSLPPKVPVRLSVCFRRSCAGEYRATRSR